ncbi:hypothetical protein [Streptomyces sp. NBC_01264]|uniref:hypothetical protein n=1 Tax=Streptomyces sp. NBC_01264 TaxID=2903804 RepID=UPI0022557313|nr:hypothetical protein [Streptomyces sp. NBC_01264]MCX4778445.1 hypothetical protein [Streptomyces sp. NBC_01264]
MSALLRLYPAAYRREFGDEIADAYHEATRGAAVPARVREGADVAGHALRMRLGLGSAGRPGRLLAALAPFALVAVGAAASSWAGVMRNVFFIADLDEIGPGFAGMVAAYLVMVFGVFLALAGRWAAGSWTVLAGTVVVFALGAVRMGIGSIGFSALTDGPMLVLALVAVACPPDLRPAPRVRTRAGVLAVMAWTLVLTSAVVLVPLVYPFTQLRFAVTLAAGLLLAGRRAFAGLRTAPAVLLAGLPVLFLALHPGTLLPLALAGLFVLLLAAAAVVSVRRRRGAGDPLVGG